MLIWILNTSINRINNWRMTLENIYFLISHLCHWMICKIIQLCFIFPMFSEWTAKMKPPTLISIPSSRLTWCPSRRSWTWTTSPATGHGEIRFIRIYGRGFSWSSTKSEQYQLGLGGIYLLIPSYLLKFHWGLRYMQYFCKKKKKKKMNVCMYDIIYLSILCV